MPSPQKSSPKCGLLIESTETTCPRDGTSLTMGLGDDPDFAQKYKISESIGAGGMGVIYKAKHLILGKEVAVKVLKSSLISEDSLRRFQIEGKAASLLSHPYIITIYDFGVTGSGQPYMVMDYVNGQTLAEMLSREGQLTAARFLPILIKVCEALAHAHERKVLHRDIKPSNIMLLKSDHGEEVKIMDFGIAKLLTDDVGAKSVTKTGDAIGSPIYMSPEQARGMKTDGRADLYSLGCVMYEALTGAPPFQGNTALDTMMMHQSDKPLPLSEASMGNKIDWALDRIVMRLLEKNPDDRYQSMDLLLADLKSLQSKGSIAGSTKTELPKKSNSLKIIVAVSSTVLLTAIGTATALTLLKDKQQTANETQAKIKPVSVPPGNAESGTARDASSVDGALLDLSTTHSKIARMVADHDQSINLKDANKTDPVTDEDMVLLKDATMANKLNLSDTGISDKGLAQLANLNLSHLNLDYTKNIKHLGAIKDMQSLLSLSARGTTYGAEGLKIIGSLSKLRELDLSASDLDGSGLHYLCKLKKLKKLRVENCHLKTQDLLRLGNELGTDCLIISDHDTYEISQVIDKAREQFSAQDFQNASNTWAYIVARMKQCTSIAPPVLANAYAKLADSEEHNKQYELAARASNDAIALIKANQLSSELLMERYLAAARCYEFSKRYATAIEYRLLVDKIISKATPESLRPTQLANLLYLSSDLSYDHKIDAVSYLARAQALAKQFNLKEFAAELNAIIKVADLYAEQGKKDKAISYYQSASKFIGQYPNKEYSFLDAYVKTAIEKLKKAKGH